jgi:hypothetical protein
MKRVPFSLQLRASLKGIKTVLRDFRYAAAAVFFAVAGLGIILWSLNYSLLGFVLFESGLPIGTKVSFVFGIYEGLFGLVDNLQSIIFVVFAALFGINLSLLIYVIVKRARFSSTHIKSAGGFAMALLAGGCAACGASILAPILLSIGVTSLLAVHYIGILVAVLGIILTAWSLFQLGKLAATLSKI